LKIQKVLTNFKNNSLIKNAGVYTISTVINSAIPFFLIPVLTRYFTPEQYGLISMHTLILAFVTPFIGFNTNNSVGRLYYTSTKEELSEYIGNCFVVLLLSFILTSLVFFFLQNILSKNTFLSPIWVWSTIIIAITQFIIVFPLSLWQVENKSITFGVFQISSTLFNFLITLVLIILLNKDWTSRIVAQIYTGLIFAFVSMYYLVKNKFIKFNFNKKLFISSLEFGIPLIPHTIGGILLSIANRYFLVKYVGLQETGVFFLAFQLTSIINIITSAINTAYVPWLFKKLSNINDKAKLRIVKLTYKYFILLILGSLLFLILLPILLKIFAGSKFQIASKYFFWLIIGTIFNGMYLMVTNYIFYSKKTYILAFSTFASAIITVFLNYILIIKIGPVGSAIASAIGFLFLFMLTWYYSNKVFPMPWLFFLKKPIYINSENI